MNTSKIIAYSSVGVGVVLNVLQTVAPILPPAWGAFVTSLLGLLAAYHIYQSHTPASLAASGYTKTG